MRNALLGAGIAIMTATVAMAHHAGEAFPVGDLVVSHAWTYETADTGHATKVYLTIQNNGDRADRLVEASADFAPLVNLQAQAIGSDGTLAVRDLAAIEIAPGQSLTLQPGAVWLQLEGLQTSFAHGQFFHLDLTFEHAGSVEIDVVVEDAEEHETEPAS